MLLQSIWQVPAKYFGVAIKADLTLLSVAHINLRRRAHIKA